MVAAIRQSVTIGQDGRIEVRSPEFKEGQRAEVIVLLNSDDGASRPQMTPLEAFKILQEGLKLTPEKAQKWIEETQAERKAWGNRE